MLIPAKMGLGQRFIYKTSWGTQGKNNTSIVRPGSFLLLHDGTVLINNNNGANANIMRFSQSGELIGTIGTSGTGLGQLQWPTGMEQLSNGDILVGDYWTERIQVFGLDGTYKYQFTGADGVHPAFGRPHGLSVDAEDNVYVVGENAGIWVYRPDGTYVRHWSTTQYGVWIEDVVQGQDGNLYVSFPNGHGVVVMTTNGQYIRTIDGTLTGGPRFAGVIGLRFDTSGLLYVTDTYAPKIRVFTADGHEVASFGEVGTGVTKISRPLQSQPLPNGTVLVSEENNSTILVFEQEQTSPTSTFSANPSTTWSTSDVTATITSSDNAAGTGVKEIHYSINMGAEQVVTGSSASFTLTEEGIHSIAYWALDNANNVEATKYATVRIDKTAPTVDGYVVSGKLMLMASDLRSGVAGIKYSLDGAAAADYLAPLTIPAGAHTYSYWSVDNAGNESVKETILVGSTVTVTIAPTSVYASKSATATIKLSVAAPAGGVTVMLSSDNPAVTIAPSVKFNAGATTINVPVQTGAVAADTSVVITASIGGSEAYGTLTVLVPFPKTLTIAPNVITGGNNAVGTITLQSNAPAGGQVVTLTSMHPDVTVPASVTVPAGALTATFSVSTKIAARDYSAAIDAEADGAGVGTTVLVKRVTPKSVTFAPSSIVGGNTSVGTVTLNVAAPTGGATVMLKSTSTFVTVPTSVTVAEGQTTATFDIATSVTARTVLANVQATAAGVRVAGVLTVSGVNVTSITLAPNSVLGGTSTTGTVNLNTSAPTGGLTVQLYTTTGIAGVPTSVTVPAGQKTATFTVTTVPVSANVLTQVVGKYLGVAKPATLTVQAAAVSTVTLTPTSVKGGTNSTLTIKLTGLAGPSGLVVTLTSSNLNAATVPATVTVPAGTDTVDVVVTTKAVTANTTSTLTAKTSASSKTVVLTVTK